VTMPDPRTEGLSPSRAGAWNAAPSMADSPNVAVVRRAFDAFTLRDVDGLVATCSPDVEFDLPTARLVRTGQPYRGHEGVRTYMRDAARVWTELRLEAREFHEAGDLVVAVGRVYAWGEGRVIDTPSAWVWKLRDGLVLRVTVFESRSEAFLAAGLATD
jgi:ketosteroid isomerase-like protein